MTTVIDEFTQAQNLARKRGFELHKADHPNERKNFTLVRHGAQTHFATIDEVLSSLKTVKP